MPAATVPPETVRVALVPPWALASPADAATRLATTNTATANRRIPDPPHPGCCADESPPGRSLQRIVGRSRPTRSSRHLACASGVCEGQTARQVRTTVGNAVRSRTYCEERSASGRVLCGIARRPRVFARHDNESDRARRATRDAKTESDRTVTNARTRRQRVRASLGVRDATAPMRTVHAMPPTDPDLIRLHTAAVALARSMRGEPDARRFVEGLSPHLCEMIPHDRLLLIPADETPVPSPGSWLTLPLEGVDHAIGSLAIAASAPAIYTEAHVTTARRIAEMLGPLVESIVLLQKEGDRRRRMAVLPAVSRVIAGSLDVGNIFQELGAAVRTVLDFDLMLVRPI